MVQTTGEEVRGGEAAFVSSTLVSFISENHYDQSRERGIGGDAS